jgi:hypothetical protein
MIIFGVPLRSFALAIVGDGGDWGKAEWGEWKCFVKRTYLCKAMITMIYPVLILCMISMVLT